MEDLARIMKPPEAERTAGAPFTFCTSYILQEATGLRAATLPQLARLLREVPEQCIYHHTHYFLLVHHYLSPEPANDLAYWVTEVLGEEPLGELLASIDTMQFASLADLREAFVQTIEEYLKRHPLTQFKFASEGEEFFFVKSLRLVLPTGVTASTLEGFAEALKRVSIYTLYYHIFDARLRLGRPTNDFAVWLEQRFGPIELVKEVAALDPYAHNLEALRSLLISLVQQALPHADPSASR